jgi:cytochrome c-type biogenesis protein CcmH/NrfF
MACTPLRLLLPLALLVGALVAPAAAQDPPAEAPAPAPAPAQAPPAAPPAAPIIVTESGDVDDIGRRVTRLADELRSPFCPGKTLMTCTSYQAFELRREMREMIESGMDDAAIIAALVDRHGEEVRNPPQPWYTVLVPLLPFLVLGVLLFWIFRKWKERDQRRETEPAGDFDAADTERLARLRARVREDRN